MDDEKDFPEFEMNYTEMLRARRLSSRECLSWEALDAYLAGTLDAQARQHADQHLTACAMCAGALKTLQAFLDPKDARLDQDPELWPRAKKALDLHLEKLLADRRSPTAVSSLPEEPASKWSPFAWLMRRPAYAYSVALLVALSLGLIFYRWALHSSPDAGPGTERRMAAPDKIQTLQPLGTVSKAALIFQWQPVSEAQYFVVAIYTPDLDTVWTSEELTTSPARLPQEIVDRLQPGKSYLWKVQAFAADKKIIKESAVQAFALGGQNY